MTAVYLVADSNLFLQCFPLEQLDWSGWRTFDEVIIVLCRPVIAEMDKHKGGPSQRRAKRAKALASQIRPLISQGAPHIQVRVAAPAVTLCAMPLLKPSETLRETLDLNVADDRIIAIAQRLKETAPGSDVRVLTNDTGMLLSAHAVGLTYAEIPTNWLMPPEASDGDKRLRAIEQRLERLEELEPRFSVACFHQGEEGERLQLTVRKYAPLTGSEVQRLIDELRQRSPMKTQFGPGEPAQRMVDGGRRTEYYTPASASIIQNYRNEYAEWERKCRRRLEQLHIMLARADGVPSVVFRAQNVGSRPAEDVLVVIKAKGALDVLPADALKADKEDGEVAFPSPPDAPAGRWEDPMFSRAQEMIRRAMRQPAFPPLALPGLHRPDARDPNAFYYKPRRPRLPGDRYELECELWRHGVEPEEFEVLLSFDSDHSEFSAALQFEIHAGNLTEKIEKPYRSKFGLNDTAYMTGRRL